MDCDFLAKDACLLPIKVAFFWAIISASSAEFHHSFSRHQDIHYQVTIKGTFKTKKDGSPILWLFSNLLTISASMLPIPDSSLAFTIYHLIIINPSQHDQLNILGIVIQHFWRENLTSLCLKVISFSISKLLTCLCRCPVTNLGEHLNSPPGPRTELYWKLSLLLSF